MANDAEIKQLKEIKKELEEIVVRTKAPRIFLNGILYGAGAFVGGIFAVAAVGWFLSFMGIIPGLNELVPYVQGIIDSIPGR